MTGAAPAGSLAGPLAALLACAALGGCGSQAQYDRNRTAIDATLADNAAAAPALGPGPAATRR